MEGINEEKIEEEEVEDSLEDLEQRLQQAIDNEDYAEAARLRDEIISRGGEIH